MLFKGITISPVLQRKFHLTDINGRVYVRRRHLYGIITIITGYDEMQLQISSYFDFSSRFFTFTHCLITLITYFLQDLSMWFRYVFDDQEWMYLCIGPYSVIN